MQIICTEKQLKMILLKILKISTHNPYQRKLKKENN